LCPRANTSIPAPWRISLFVSLFGVLVVWFAIYAMGARRRLMSRSVVVSTLVVSSLLIAASVGYMGTNPTPASALALSIALLFAAWTGAR